MTCRKGGIRDELGLFLSICAGSQHLLSITTAVVLVYCALCHRVFPTTVELQNVSYRAVDPSFVRFVFFCRVSSSCSFHCLFVWSAFFKVPYLASSLKTGECSVTSGWCRVSELLFRWFPCPKSGGEAIFFFRPLFLSSVKVIKCCAVIW